MNFKDFKKVDVTKTHTVFKHPSGHTIHVAHDSLTPEQKKQMRDIPIQSAKERLREAKQMAKGGMATKPEQVEIKYTPKQFSPEEEQFYERFKEPRPLTPKEQQFMQQTEPRPIPMEQLQQRMQGLGVGEPRGEYVPGEMSKQMLGAEQKQPTGPTNVSLDDYLAPTAKTAMPEEMPKSAYQKELETTARTGERIKSIQEEAAAEEAKSLQQTMNKLQSAASVANAEKTRLRKMMDDVNQAIMDNKIDPNKYVGSMSTIGRVSTAIGLILGGMGAGLTGGQNLAFKAFESAIDRDVEAQKLELNKKNNLLTAYYKMYGDVQQAEAATKAQLMSMAQLQAQQIAARSRSAQAAQQNELFQAQLNTKREQYESQVAQAKADKVFSESTKQQGRPLPTDEEVAGYLRRVPGASEKEKEKSQTAYIEYTKGLEAIETLKTFMNDQYQMSRLSTLTSPGDRADLLKTYKMALAPITKSVTGETRMSDSEFEKFVDPLISKVYTDPETVQKQINILMQSKNAEMQGHLSQLRMMGLHFPKPIIERSVPSLQRK